MRFLASNLIKTIKTVKTVLPSGLGYIWIVIYYNVPSGFLPCSLRVMQEYRTSADLPEMDQRSL